MILLVIGAPDSTFAAGDPLAWPPVTAQCKPWAYNWWLGSAVNKPDLTRELERYAAAGLGGIQIIPIYGAVGFESKYIKYLSPGWMEMMGWAVTEAHRLGMGVDMSTGSGWCFGGPQVSNQDANASVIVKTFKLVAGERLKEKFNRTSTQALVAFSPDGKSIELTDTISTTGEVSFSPPGGGCIIYAISQTPSGQMVKRPGPGGEGWMLNPIYPPAMDDYLKRFTTAFAAYHGPKPRAQYHDSYEYHSDWSPGFFAEFKQRRGYELQSELPALFGTGTDDHSARVKCDYRRTVSEIMAGESMPAWTKWSHDEGFITRYQAHGSPGNWLDLYATADIPETEMFSKCRSILVSKFASSSAHVSGKSLVSSETGTWLAEHFTEKLSDVKYLVDDMFLSGVNHLFYHGCCYSPDEVGWPGWLFYASTEMNPRNPVWRDVGAVNAYAARCQSILQSGAPDNDILLYWPLEDFWMQPGSSLLPQITVSAREWFESQPIGRTSKALWDRGYAFDYVSDAQLKIAKVADGKIQMPGGKYRVVLVPECKFIPLETFKQLLVLAENGASVIFENQLPADVSGGKDLGASRAEFRKLSGSIKFSASGDGVVGKGHMFRSSLESELAAAKVPRELLTSAGLSFVRRSFNGGWHYFIANRGATSFDGWVALGRPAKSVVILNPMTGSSGVAATRQSTENSIQVHLQLPAGESAILRAFADHIVEGPTWNYWQSDGRPVEINSQWDVKFIQGGPALPADFHTGKLCSWTLFPDKNAQVFAGTAKYETVFGVPDSAGKDFEINLGCVCQSARVKVNGKDYGTLITPPFRVFVDNLKPVGNQLVVEVTSVAANRIRDLDLRGVPWKTFHDINMVDINYKPFDASNWPLADCGLLGPVTLMPVTLNHSQSTRAQ